MSNGSTPYGIGISSVSNRRKGHHAIPLRAWHLGEGTQHVTDPIELFSRTTAPYYRFLDERERERIGQS